MKKRILPILLIVCIIFNIFVIAACGDNNTPPGSKATVMDIAVEDPQTEYTVGDTWDISGGVLTLIMTDDTKQTIPFTHEGVEVTTPDLTTAGNKTVTVRYDGFETSYQITVTAAMFKVTFNYNYTGAPSVEVVSVESNGTVAVKNAVRDGFRFDGWFTAAEGGKKFDSSARITADIQLYAHWTELFEVKFDLNYEDAPEATVVNVALGEKVTASQAPATDGNAGYIFNGWYTAAEGGTQFDFESAITADLVLYAQWNEIGSQKVYTVTFDYNYPGAPAATNVQVIEGNTVAKPADPVRYGSEFEGWYTDKEGDALYDFGTAVNEDRTLYAHWSVEFYVVEYKYVLDGEEISYTSKEVTPNTYLDATAVGMPVVTGYVFAEGRWYTDKECEQLFDFNNTRINQNYVFYAKPLTRYTFEAEYTYIDPEKQGVGQSNGANGISQIGRDNGTANASNGFWMSSLFLNGAFVEFVIESDRDVDDAILILRLSAEWNDTYLAPESTTVDGQNYDSFEIMSGKAVLDENGDPVTGNYGCVQYTDAIVYVYEPIAMEGAVKFEDSDRDKRPFDDHYITGKLTLHKGLNVIRLVVTNNHYLDGTMAAAAPMVDCMYIQTEAKLT